MMDGPDLFYPPPGKIAVMDSGGRVAIWPWEENGPETFCGQMLLPNRTSAQVSVIDVSCLWSRTRIKAIEEPTDADRQLSIYEL